MSFFEPIGRSFAQLVEPLAVSLSAAEELELFLAAHGWDARVAGGSLDAIRGTFAVVHLVEEVINNLDKLISGTDAQRVRAVMDVIYAAKAVVDRIDALASLASGVLPFPFNQAAFWQQISRELVDELCARYLEGRQPLFFGILHVMGIIRYERTVPVGQGRFPYIKTTIYWEDLPKILTGPAEQFRDRYKWGVPGEALRHDELVRAFERTVVAFHRPAAIGPPRKSLATGNLPPTSIEAHGVSEVELPFVDGISSSDASTWKIGAVIVPIPDSPTSAAAPSGLMLSPVLAGQLSLVQYFAPGIGLRLAGAFESSGIIRAKIFPDRAALETDLADASFDAKFALFGDPDEPWLLFGDRGGMRLELDGFLGEIGMRGRLTDPEVYFSLGTGAEDNKVRLVLDAGEGDGFVQKLVPEDGFTLEFGANLHWSSKTGVAFDGSAALDFVKHIHLALGPITIETVYVSAHLGANGRLDLDLGAGIKAELGPLVAVVENIGLRTSLVPTAPGRRGAFGNLDLEFGFKPPNGVGLSLDAGPVKGGGYLFFDFDREEYAGALQLVFSGWINLTAIGLVTTRMPDGSKGFSLLIIITAEFGTGIQLGYGFTLLGVGGLLGVNRTMKLEPLMEGVRTGAVDGIMFPRDVIANAPRLISDLRTIFPPEEGKFLIGPMAKIGWGTPTLISLSLGIIIEIPGNIAIVGVLRLALPTPDDPILILQVSFAGAIEFDKKRVFFFASLFESRVLFMTIEGEMGMLAAFGDDANFVLSVGGFHPRFEPPPLPFPVPRRIAINVLDTDWGRIKVSGYFAITSNSAQFGAKAELFFGFSGFSIEGWFAFDALFRFSPFYFIIEIGASVALKVLGASLLSIRLQFALEGPTPWRARGSGSISILFFEISADFDVTWGEARQTTLEPIDVLGMLETELQKPQSWTAFLPPGSNQRVSIRAFGADDPNLLVLHPVGVLRVAQRAVPLDLTISRVGHQRPSDANRFSLAATGGLAKEADVEERFAPAQFLDLDDAAKLSRPAFEPQHGGIDLGAVTGQASSAKLVRRVPRHELIVLDTNFRRFTAKFVNFIGVLFSFFLRGNAAARSKLSRQTLLHTQPFLLKIEARSPEFVVAATRDNTAVAGGRFASEAAAHDFMNRRVASDPSSRDSLHVIPVEEARAA